MTQAAEPEKKPKTDWESIEKHYRAGVLPLREIGRLHDVSDTAIRKKAKVHGWLRDLTAKVNEKVRAELVRTEVRTANAKDQLRTEREIVDSAAGTVVEVVRSHRRDISSGRDIVGLLMQQLTDVAGRRSEFEEAIEIETADDQTTERRNKLMKAVSIPVHAVVVRDLSIAMKNLIGLERQAFNISDVADEKPTHETATDDDLDRAIAVYAAKAGIGFTPAGEG
ncbi:hypothetical protein [Herminiimonas sp. CN]|uniref:hypothetical protein n=1 Tax=Herminiimonas sp. CN TaxID=1349818 RepID=UPI00047363A1|nr:hypothetical protein [Herminiimonas sp. CN]